LIELADAAVLGCTQNRRNAWLRLRLSPLLVLVQLAAIAALG